MLALLVDLCCISAISGLVGQVLAVLRLIGDDLAAAATMFAYFALSLGYGIVGEWLWRGQTPGKRLLRLRVMDASGRRLEPGQVVLRNLLRAADMLPAFYLLGGVVCLASSRSQRLGDIAAGTVVVRVEELAPPDLDQLLGSRFNSMLEHRRLSARLRQRTPPELAAAALDAITRREDLEPAARLAVFAGLAGRFRALVEFPPEAVEGLADEQYARNAVEIVFRPSAPTTLRAR